MAKLASGSLFQVAEVTGSQVSSGQCHGQGTGSRDGSATKNAYYSLEDSFQHPS